ncbi:MAG: hypothetical protein IPH44_36050 [Myxococcales bacterium]|nr:hypothetical protein [Myxococcales bacterium]MBK7191203.1 hypothetical protein [Myxococcales bacterium]MBP6846158.1 hypothetical protein [Kofleriaceae bacterium]
MFSSLHKIDIVATSPTDGGATLLVQTDHRTPAEVGADQGLSMIFALTRMLVPRSGEYATATVRYTCVEAVHPLLETAAAACGAELEGARQARDLTAVARQDPADLADAAFATMGRRVMAERGLAVDEGGLTELVEAMARPPALDDDELGHYTALVELAAATGEVLRARFGGRWVRDLAQHSVVPFVFQLAVGNDMRANVVGKAEKYFRFGAIDSPVLLLRGGEDATVDEGPLLFTLKPAGWEPAATLVAEPIAPGLEAAGASVPLMVYGHDRPNTFAMLGKDKADVPPLPTLRAQALRTLAELEVETERLDVRGTEIVVVHGSYFAAEKILDAAFLRRLHAELGCELLAAAVPEKSRLLVTQGVAAPAALAGFMAVAQGIYDADEGGRQLSPTVFAIQDGAIVGVLTADGASPRATGPAGDPPKKRSFWRRLFGKG